MSLSDVERYNIEVKVSFAPYDTPFERLKRLLAEYGSVSQIRRKYFRDDPSIATGNLLVRMQEITKSIPRTLRLGGHMLQITYRGQIPQCFKCGEQGHRALTCTNGFKCFNVENLAMSGRTAIDATTVKKGTPKTCHVGLKTTITKVRRTNL